LRKFIYGPGIDEPLRQAQSKLICMIDVAVCKISEHESAAEKARKERVAEEYRKERERAAIREAFRKNPRGVLKRICGVP